MKRYVTVSDLRRQGAVASRPTPLPARRQPSACGRAESVGVDPATAAAAAAGRPGRRTVSCDVDRWPPATRSVRSLQQPLKHVNMVINHTLFIKMFQTWLCDFFNLKIFPQMTILLISTPLLPPRTPTNTYLIPCLWLDLAHGVLNEFIHDIKGFRTKSSDVHLVRYCYVTGIQ